MSNNKNNQNTGPSVGSDSQVNPLEGATRLGDSFTPTPDQLNALLGDALGQAKTPLPTQQYLQSIFNQYVGQREQALADLSMLLQHGVGVGDHANVGETIKSKIEEAERYDSLVGAMDKWFAAGEAGRQMAQAKNEG